MQNKVVVHYMSSTIVKGVTSDFFPNKQFFHLTMNQTGEVRKVNMHDLKAVFFVKTFDGDPGYEETQDGERAGLGKKIKIHFKDGEVLFGYTQGYSEERRGFSVVPVDPKSNNERVFVCRNGTTDVGFVDIEASSQKGVTRPVEVGNGPGVKNIDEDIIILCPSCGVRNKFKTSMLDMKPRCGKCKTRLV
jgi:hypothetical protein